MGFTTLAHTNIEFVTLDQSSRSSWPKICLNMMRKKNWHCHCVKTANEMHHCPVLSDHNPMWYCSISELCLPLRKKVLWVARLFSSHVHVTMPLTIAPVNGQWHSKLFMDSGCVKNIPMQWYTNTDLFCIDVYYCFSILVCIYIMMHTIIITL